MFEAYQGAPLQCFIERLYPRYFPLLYRFNDRKIFLAINNEFAGDEELSRILSTTGIESKEIIVDKYAKFVQHRLLPICSGKAWL